MMSCKMSHNPTDHRPPDSNTPSLHRHDACHRRRGSLLIEMVVCTMLLSVVALVLVPGIFAVHQQRMHARVETLTMIELNNVANRLRHANDNTAALSPWFTARYPDSKLEVTPISANQAAETSPAWPQALRLRISRPAPEGLPPWNRDLVIWKAEPDPIDKDPEQAATTGRDSAEQERAE